MNDSLNFIAAFSIGLLGSSHCLAMCGGIAGALSFALPKQKHWLTKLFYQLCYSLGRIASYAAIGFLAGSIGFSFDYLLGNHGAFLLRIVAGSLLISMGLYIAGLWRILVKLEKLGFQLWRKLSPITQKFIPVIKPIQAILLGMLWGWLPCGLVYSAVIWSASAGNAYDSALLMAGFGLGTLPMLLLASGFSQSLAKFIASKQMRKLFGGLLVIFGIWTLWMGLGNYLGLACCH